MARSKRANGEGTEILWDEKKEYFFQRIGYTSKSGVPKVKAIYGHTKVEVVKKRKKWQKDLDAKLDMDSEKLTYGNWLSKWIETYKRDIIEVTSIELYETLINKHILPEFKDVKIKDIERLVLQEFLNKKKKDLKRSGLELLRTILRNSLEHATADNKIIKNPAIGLKIPKVAVGEKEKSKIKPFTREELSLIFKEAEGKYILAISVVAAYTGLRKGEILGLRRQDIDFKKNIIKVRQGAKYSRSQKDMLIGNLKTENASRDVPAVPMVMAMLKEQMALQAKNKMRLGDGFKHKDLIFVDEAGEVLRPGTITNAFHRAVDKAGVPYRSFHQLRHTFASIYISCSKKVNIKALSEMLGHANIQITYDTYGHLLEGDAESVTETVANYLAGS